MFIPFHDERTGDSYDVEIDDNDRTFIRALRYIDAIGQNPVEYFRLDDVPPMHLPAIKALLYVKCPTHSK